MRPFLLLLLLCLPGALAAWEFTPDPVCTLRDETSEARTEITYDAASALYTLTLMRKAGPWLDSPHFGMAFRGGRALTIGTAEHRIDGNVLGVTDRGFGNVLDGLEFNDTAQAFTDRQSITLDLSDAAAPVRAFRACAAAGPVTS